MSNNIFKLPGIEKPYEEIIPKILDLQDVPAYSTKISISVRIDTQTPVHTYLSLFVNMIPVEQDHAQATRAKSGNFVLRNEEVQPFLDRLQPDIVIGDNS